MHCKTTSPVIRLVISFGLVIYVTSLVIRLVTIISLVIFKIKLVIQAGNTLVINRDMNQYEI